MNKYIIILFGLLASCFNAFADKPEMADTQDIAHMQAIVARRVNIVSLPDSASSFNSIVDSELSIRTLKNKLGKNDKNIQLTNQIASHKPKGNVTLDEAKSFFSDSIFETEVLVNFFDKSTRKDSIDIVKKDIASQITDYILFVNAERDKQAKEEEKASKMENPAQIENDSDGLFSWPVLFAALIILILACATLFFYNAYQKVVKENEKRRKDMKQLEWKLDALNRQFVSLKKEKDVIEYELADYKAIVERMKSVKSYEPTTQTSSIRPNTPPTYLEPEPQPETFYAVNCDNGVFSNISRSYRKGQYLYKLTIIGNSGTYKFINDSQTVELAKTSRSIMIESACDIVNDDVRTFNEVITEQPGHIINDGNSWRVTRKAIVRLS